MDVIAKLFMLLVMGCVLVAANVWFVGMAIGSFTGGNLVIAPIRIVGGSPSSPGLEETMARMLLVRLRSIASDLEWSQTSLRKGQDAGAAETIESATSLLRPARTVHLAAQLFEPDEFKLAVAGVEVGGFLPRIERWFVKSRTLTFNVSLADKKAFVAGTLEPLGSDARPIWLEVADPSPQNIADQIAFAVVQRAWARDGGQIGDLSGDEFRTLVTSLSRVADINRRVRTFKTAGQAEYIQVLKDLIPITDRIASWQELNYLTATVAEGADDKRRALSLYQRLSSQNATLIPAGLLATKLDALRRAPENLADYDLTQYKKKAAEAALVLDDLFDVHKPPPSITLITSGVINAYWDGHTINIPPGLQDIPDILFHELSWSYIVKVWKIEYSGQNGALANAYADILASVVKQQLLGQSAQEADWTIGPGGIAWITGRLNEIAQDQRPLRSLKAPGTAYKDAGPLGDDRQVAKYEASADYEGDLNAVHTYSGIGSKAFYEAAMLIGTDVSAKIWVAALKTFDNKTDYPKAAQLIEAAAIRLHGENSRQAYAVKAAWAAVGL